jgi:hypothetical protein
MTGLARSIVCSSRLKLGDFSIFDELSRHQRLLNRQAVADHFADHGDNAHMRP